MTSPAKTLAQREMREGCAPAGSRRRRHGGLWRRRLGGVGERRLLAYCARSPARSAAQGHARTSSSKLLMELEEPRRNYGFGLRTPRSTAASAGVGTA